jgi:hypothetical protein
MTDIRKLLESMDAMSAAEQKSTGPKWPGYWRGKDSAKKSKSRMVGDGGTSESVEESENFIKELNTLINSNPVKRDLFQEWQEYKSISEAEKTVSPDQKAQIRKDVKSVSGNYGKEQQQQTTPPSPEQKAGIKQAVKDYNQEKQDKKQTVDERKEYMSDVPIAEYGAPGSGIGNDTATNPAEVFAKGQERKASKEQAQGQIQGLVAQIVGLRNQLADLNSQFPQGANPVEKTMSLQQMTAQRNGIKSQIVDLAKQISQLRQQA